MDKISHTIDGWIGSIGKATGLSSDMTVISIVATVAIFLFLSVLLTIRIALAHGKLQKYAKALTKSRLLYTAIWILPTISILVFLEFITSKDPTLIFFRRIVSSLLTILIAISFRRLLDTFINQYAYIESRKRGKKRFLKGYSTVWAVIIYVITAIVVFSIILDKSPTILLTSIAGMTAIILLLFKETLQSMFANILIGGTGMVEVGDWISIPSMGASGTVRDISLNLVKIVNWDKTFTIIPTYQLVQNHFINYRGMYLSKTRRITRTMQVDATSLRFLKDHEITDIVEKLPMLRGEPEAYRSSAAMGEKDPCSYHIANMALFRRYISLYLHNHPDIHQKSDIMARELCLDATQINTAKGIPLQVYCFVNNTDLEIYENIQAGLFDHFYSVLPIFFLRPYQLAPDDDQGPGTNPAAPDNVVVAPPTAALTPPHQS